MKSWLKHIPQVAVVLLLLVSCGRVSSRETVFRPEEEEETDTTCVWLEDPVHFHTEIYYPVFNAFYEQQLKQKNYVKAATAMEIVANKEIHFASFTEAFREQLETFDTLYAGLIPWQKSLFVESYTGNRFMDLGEFRKAIACIQKVTIYKPVDYASCMEIANLNCDIAFCYSAIGDQEKALQANLKALSYFNQAESLNGKAIVYDNIALVHLFTKNYTEAEVFFDKAINAYKAAGNSTNMFTTIHNRILLYEETGDPRKNQLIDSAYWLFASSGIDDASIEVALSSFYVEKLVDEGRMAEAKSVLEKMKGSLGELNSAISDDDYNIALAQYELKTSTGLVNTELMEKALVAVEESEHYQNQLAFCDVLKADAVLHGDYKKALMYSEKEKIALDKLANREIIVKTMELNKKHQTERKEQRIALQTKTILNKNIAIALLLSAFVMLCLIILVIYNRQKQKKALVEGQRAILYTRQLLQKTEEERRRIAGDLHDSVSHELLSLKNAIRDDSSETGSKIDAIINDIRIISRNLHPIMFEKVGLAASIEQLVERAQSVNDLMVTADIDYDGFLSVSDELQVYRIIQEALSNIIKYAEAVAAKIIIVMRNDVLHIQVKDNGKGFNVAAKMAGSTAFGLHNILERSKAIDGFARIHSDHTGTIITIEIKKHENTTS